MLAIINNQIIIPLAVILIIQYCLALFALMRLFKNKPDKLNSVVWNIIIVLLIIIGPIIYLSVEKPYKKTPEKIIIEEEKTKDYTDYSI